MSKWSIFLLFGSIIAATVYVRSTSDQTAPEIDESVETQSVMYSSEADALVETNDEPKDGTTDLGKQSHSNGSDAAPPGYIPASVYPERPMELYNAHLTAAVDGDVGSQYQLYRALSECDEIMTSHAQIDELESRTNLTTSIQELRFRLNRCSEMHESLGDNLKEQRMKWRHAALANGHPILRAETFLDSGRLSEARLSIATALTSGDSRAFQLAGEYVGATQGHLDPLSTLPWEYLTCEANPTCAPESILELLSIHLPDHDVEALLEMAAGIRTRIAEGDLASVLPAESVN